MQLHWFLVNSILHILHSTMYAEEKRETKLLNYVNIFLKWAVTKVLLLFTCFHRNDLNLSSLKKKGGTGNAFNITLLWNPCSVIRGRTGKNWQMVKLLQYIFFFNNYLLQSNKLQLAYKKLSFHTAGFNFLLRELIRRMLIIQRHTIHKTIWLLL